MKIIHVHVHPPIPVRRFDWCAYDESTYDGEPGQLVGWGTNPKEAENDLIEQMEEA